MSSSCLQKLAAIRQLKELHGQLFLAYKIGPENAYEIREKIFEIIADEFPEQSLWNRYYSHLSYYLNSPMFSRALTIEDGTEFLASFSDWGDRLAYVFDESSVVFEYPGSVLPAYFAATLSEKDRRNFTLAPIIKSSHNGRFAILKAINKVTGAERVAIADRDTKEIGIDSIAYRPGSTFCFSKDDEYVYIVDELGFRTMGFRDHIKPRSVILDDIPAVVESVEISQDGRNLIVFGGLKLILIDIENEVVKEILPKEVVASGINSFCYDSKTDVILYHTKGVIHSYNMQSKKSSILSREASLAYQLSTDGKFLISDTGKKGEIQIKHIKSGRLVKSLKLSKNHWVKDLRLTPDGKIIVLDTKGIVSIFLEEKWINRQETRKSI